MQPYFLPYIGYFQLISAVDEFIVYDNIEYTKKGWINRNRMLSNGRDVLFSLPLKSDSDYLDIRDRQVSAQFDRRRLLAQFQGAYRRAPQFEATFELLEAIIGNEEQNLFAFLFSSIRQVCEYLSIDTKLCISSEIAIDAELRGQDKVLQLCAATGASTYINASGGVALYSSQDFDRQGVELRFIRSKEIEYPQFGARFVPWLSIVDVLMFNPLERVVDLVMSGYEVA